MPDLNRTLSSGASVLHGAAFACVTVVVLASPWCFGAWETWWFWPLAALLFLGTLLAGIGTLLNSAFVKSEPAATAAPRLRSEGRLAGLLAATLPFLVYAGWRAAQPSAPGLPLVAMEAERSLLLFFTPCLLVLTLCLTATRPRLRRLVALFLANAVAVASYAVINHWQTDDAYVLWVKTPFNYGARAGGPFFCPNHLAAFLNIALCLVLAIQLTRKTPWTTRLALAFVSIPILLAWFLTLSRGGTASLALCLPVVLLAGLRGYPWRLRLAATLTILLLAGASVWAVATVDNPLLNRLRNSSFVKTVLKAPDTGWEPVRDAFFNAFDRGLYIASALRAWRSNPTWGIGPGQHAIRWPQFAATEDGDRATGKWPTRTNHEYYLYEVHSDWVQLLEEYGKAGLGLFLLAWAAVVGMLVRSQGQTLRAGAGPADADAAIDRALPLAALLALTALTIHSLGDFSLQIPAIVWSLAALTACGLLAPLPTRGAATSDRHGTSDRRLAAPTEMD